MEPDIIYDNPWHLEVTQTPVVDEYGGDEWNRQFLGRRGLRTTCTAQVMKEGKPVCSLALNMPLDMAEHFVEAHNIWLASQEIRRI